MVFHLKLLDFKNIFKIIDCSFSFSFFFNLFIGVQVHIWTVSREDRKEERQD